MDVLEYLLDGLEAALELERDLGVRTIEVDRGLLTPPAPVAPVASAAPVSGGQIGGMRLAAPVVPLGMASAAEVREKPARREGRGGAAEYDFIFLHDRPLSAGGVEMMAKIVTALGRTADTAPVVIVPPIPRSKVAVALGVGALRKFFPGLRGSPGQWLKASDGRDVLVSNSPDEILRYGTVTPAVMKIKREMWRNLKVVLQRIAQ